MDTDAAPLEGTETTSQPVAPSPVVAPVPPAAAPPAPPPTVTPAPPAPAAVQTPETQAAQRATVEESARQRVSQLEAFYTLPEADAVLITVEPEKVLPKMATKVHMAIMQEVYAALQREVPAIVKFHADIDSREAQAKQRFYSVNDDLVGYEAQVLAMGQVYRQHNPQATPEEATVRIGNLVRAALGMPPRGVAQPANTVPVTTPRQAAPFVPAHPGGAALAAPAQSGNLYEQLAEELLQEDLRG